MTTLQNLLKIRYPIIAAPMAYVSGGNLAGAVSKAGGLGLIGGGYGDLERRELGPEWINQQFDQAHEHYPDFSPSETEPFSPVGIGFITWALGHNPRLLSVALSRKPRAVMLSFGDPSPYVEEIHSAGSLLICQVQTVEEALHAVKAGADIIAAQGGEAGGHGRTVRGTMALVPAIVDAVPAHIPVVAAGGIADGRGIAAAIALGARGVLMGTRFLVSKESGAHEKTKQKVMSAKGDETFRTRLWDALRGLDWPPQYNARTTRNQFSDKWDGKTSELTEKELQEYNRARDAYDFSVYTAWCGECVDLIKEETEIPSAAEIIQSLLRELKQHSQRVVDTASTWDV